MRDTGARIEELLAGLVSGGPAGAGAAAEELVRLLVGLYGDGLTQIVTVLREQGQPGDAMLRRLAEEPVVESLLLLHDLHPLDVDARVQRALDRVRPYLGSHAGGVEYLGVAGGVARLRLEGSCHGCPSSADTVRLAISGAVLDAAPEVDDVVVEGMTALPEPQLLQIGRRPGPPRGGPDDASGGAGPAAGWVTLPGLGPPSSRPVTAAAGHLTVLVCSVRGTLYAYLDGCAACGHSLGDGTLDRGTLSCPACQTRYDVCLAGRGLDDPGLHLDPLPLLADSAGVHVAVPEAVAPEVAAPEVAAPEVAVRETASP
jgi:Fe-S cluster biogenesis protein NfuA/nitrite reductase/ring-hydroxylating ferredoxin subunit